MSTKSVKKYDCTSSTISPIDAYEIINKFMPNLEFEERFILMRFFDKLVDASGYQMKCKQNLSTIHMKSKNLYSKRQKLYSGSSAVTIMESCVLLPVKEGSEVTWNFMMNGETLLKGLSPDTAFKIIKDVNTAFQLMASTTKSADDLDNKKE